MFESGLKEHAVAGVTAGPQHQADVHHDVDEQRCWTEERAEIAALLPALGQCSACGDQHVAQLDVARQAILAQIGREEDKAEIVDRLIVLARLQAMAQFAGRTEPLVIFRVLVEQPEQAGKSLSRPGRY